MERKNQDIKRVVSILSVLVGIALLVSVAFSQGGSNVTGAVTMSSKISGQPVLLSILALVIIGLGAFSLTRLNR